MGVRDPGFGYLLQQAGSGRVWVKLSAPYRIWQAADSWSVKWFYLPVVAVLLLSAKVLLDTPSPAAPPPAPPALTAPGK